ncbi:MAG: nitrile hydratase [Planctomycetota bacterium]|jgi:nitrile hydratase
MSHSHEHKHPHKHPLQPDSEDEPQSYYQTVAQAVEELLIEKGLISSNEMATALDYWASKTPSDGARIVARCWTDSRFAANIEKEGVNKAAAALDLDVGSTPIVAALNTPAVHNVLVCTLCSCYPVGLLGESPGWYKSRAYRARVVREPRAVLAEFGTELPPDIEVRVHDSTADLRYIVIPMRPAGTEDMTEEQLATLVTRDCMIGTTVPIIETN